MDRQYPWSMDKPVQEFRNTGWYGGLSGFDKDVVDYFLDRIEKTEERAGLLSLAIALMENGGDRS